MEKFKNALKSVNKFGLLALVFVAFATLAFKAPIKRAGTLYGKVPVTSANPTGWVDASSLTRQDTPPYPNQSYRCDNLDDICTAEFMTPPTNHSSIPSGEVEDGEFLINED